MDKYSLLNQIGLVSVFASGLLALFLITVKSRNQLANRLFAGFLIVTAIDLSGFLPYKYAADYPALEVFRLTISALNMPLFYLYILAGCYTNFRLKLKHLLLAIPFLFFNAALLPRFYLADHAAKLVFLKNFGSMPEALFFHALNEFLYVIYMIAVFKALRNFKKIYRENYTDVNIKTYHWLFQISVVSVAAHSIVIFKNFLRFSDFQDVFLWANVIVGSIALSVLSWFVLKALYNPEIFSGVDSKLPLAEDIVRINKTSAERQPAAVLSVADVTAQNEKLMRYMTEHEPFLNPSLTIHELSAQLKMPVRDLSVLINHHLNRHFFDFVNEYRINKAMEMLKDPRKKKLTILEILYEVGFNSKSSFNTAFKKRTNQTPTEFRNRALSTG